MRLSTLCLGALLSCGTLFAQNAPPSCIVRQTESQLEQQQSARAAERKSYEQEIQRWVNAHGNSVQSVITIPVVVHIVWNQSAQNISNNQVFSQIQVLNEDFGRTNADTGNAPAVFQALAANPNIQYCLAQQDPSGNSTSGIERTQTTVSYFSPNNAVKHASQGGADAWDPTRYFNIWVCNLIPSGQSGYGEFPASTVSQTFGLVVDYHFFGSDHTSYGGFTDITAPYDYGRTATHEISHCWDLINTWANDGNTCNGSDSCADTPNQSGASSGCPSFPSTDACSPSSPGVMFCNFLDLSSESCRNMFTADQVTRMLAVLNTPPYNALVNSVACYSPASSPPQALFSCPGSSCAGSALMFTDASLLNPTSWSWTFSGGSPASSSLQNPPAVTWSTPGTYTVTLTASNSNGSSIYTCVVNVYAAPSVPSITVNGDTLTSSVSGNSYQWYLNGSPIAGATSQSYTATQTGTYTVEVFGPGNCSSGQSAGVVDPTGIAAVSSVENLSLAPNPNDGRFELRFTTSQAQDFVLEIHNALGQVVYSETLEHFNGAYERTIDLSAFGKGVYTVRLKGASGETVLRAVTY